MKSLNLFYIVFVFTIGIIFPQGERIEIPKDKFTKEYLTKVIIEYLNNSSISNTDTEIWSVQPLHTDPVYKKMTGNLLPNKNVQGVYRFHGTWEVHDEDIYHVMFIYDDHVMIYPEAEQHTMLDELLNYTNKYSLNKTSYDKIANSITTLFYENYYRNRITKPIDSSEVVYKNITIMNQSDKSICIYILYPFRDTVLYVLAKDYIRSGKSEKIGFIKKELDYILKRDSTITIIVISKENAYKYEKETEKTPEDWLKLMTPLKKFTLTAKELDSLNWTLTYP